MNNSINIDLVVASVKNIVDNNRCVICDKTNGTFMRYPCGHTSCEECATVAEDCSLCLTPLQHYSFKTPIPDEPLTQRVRNAEVLLNACQDVFHTDVYRRKRISDQLKIEKELFPKCIQAPVKYSNKRKSLNSSFKNKENHPLFFGENILSLKEKKMENSFKYVKQWLNNNEKNVSRKPFTDLNTNQQRLSRNNRCIKTKPDVKSNIENYSSQKTNRKRSHFETAQKITKTQSHILDNQVKSDKKVKTLKKFKKEIEKQHKADSNNDMERENDNDGSGIDDEAVVVIDDSQNVDKDRNAWLAVLEADKRQQKDTASVVRLESAVTERSTVKNTFVDKNELIIKVPFYKKSYVLETCKYCCNDFYKYNHNASTTDKSSNVSITVESNSFTTIINVTKNVAVNTRSYDMHSVSVQTDINKTLQLNNDIKKSKTIYDKNDNRNLQVEEENLLSAKYDVRTCSQDILKDEKIIFENLEDIYSKDAETNLKSTHKTLNVTKCIIIDESDSDDDIDAGCSLEVTADIHRSCNQSEYGILTEVENQEGYEYRTRRTARGLTPTSTDSSEKENFDPNRIKKKKLGKKTYTKK